MLKILLLDLCLESLTLVKTDVPSDLVGKAPRPRVDIDIQKRLDALKKDNLNFNRNNSNDLSPPLQPPSFNNFIPLPPQPPSFNNFIPPPPQPPWPQPPPSPTNFDLVQLPPPPLSFNFPSPPQILSKATTTKTKTKPNQEQLIEDIEKAIYEIPDPTKIEIGDSLLSVLENK